jgi:hypothetical protein
VTQSEDAGDLRRRDFRLVVHAEDGSKRSARREGDGIVRGLLRIPEVDGGEAFSAEAVQGTGLFRRDGDVDVQRAGSGEEVRRPIGGRRQQQQDARPGAQLRSESSSK